MTTTVSPVKGLRVVRLAALALLIGAASCGGGSGGIGAVSCGMGAPAPVEAPPLAGTWNASFEVSGGNAPASAARRAEGQIVIDAVPPPAGEPATPAAARSVMKGRFAIDFAPLGFTVDGASAIAWHSAAPSLSIILNPDAEHGNLAITGIQSGDSIEGQWQLLGAASPVSGRVRLTRGAR